MSLATHMEQEPRECRSSTMKIIWAPDSLCWTEISSYFGPTRLLTEIETNSSCLNSYNFYHTLKHVSLSIILLKHINSHISVSLFLFYNKEIKIKRLRKSMSIKVHNQFSSVTQSCPTLCDPMNCITPGLPAHHHLLESIHVH